MKRSELTCDSCGQTEAEEFARADLWLKLTRPKENDHHFCGWVCLRVHVLADGADKNQGRLPLEGEDVTLTRASPTTASITIRAEDAAAFTQGVHAATRDSEDAGFGGGDRAALGQRLEQAWAARGVTVTRDAAIAVEE